jgi:hypothetical protein
MWFGLVIGFIELLHLVTTSEDCAITVLHISCELKAIIGFAMDTSLQSSKFITEISFTFHLIEITCLQSRFP